MTGGLPIEAPCCDLHRPGDQGVCCDPEDCGPCCQNCPTCPTLILARAQGQAPPPRAYTDPPLSLYTERAHLVAHLARVYPAHLAEDPDEPAWLVVCVHTPTGQMGWHIAQDDLVMFDQLLVEANDFDGHTTVEKYERLDRLDAWPNPVTSEEEATTRIRNAWHREFGGATWSHIGTTDAARIAYRALTEKYPRRNHADTDHHRSTGG